MDDQDSPFASNELFQHYYGYSKIYPGVVSPASIPQVRSSHLIAPCSLTCRKRHVKCEFHQCCFGLLNNDHTGDESVPRCGQCSRRDEQCSYEDSFRFRSPILGSGPRVRKQSSRKAAASPSILPKSPELGTGPANWSLTNNDDWSTPPYTETATTSAPAQHSTVQEALDINVPLEQWEIEHVWSPSSARRLFSFGDAIYIHHFATELGRWLDCTDPSRQFTAKIPEMVADERILLLAVTCFAARHMKHQERAATAHEEAIQLLISKLDAVDVAADDALLCSIVILRVYEQLDGASS